MQRPPSILWFGGSCSSIVVLITLIKDSRNYWNDPLNSSFGIIVHQKCVEPICNDDGLKRIDLQKRNRNLFFR